MDVQSYICEFLVGQEYIVREYYGVRDKVSMKIPVTAQFLPGILDANLCKNKQTNN